MALFPANSSTSVVKSKTITESTNAAGAIDCGTYITNEVIISAYSTNTNNYRLIPFATSNGSNYLQGLDNTWTKLGSGISLTITYYYIKNA